MKLTIVSAFCLGLMINGIQGQCPCTAVTQQTMQENGCYDTCYSAGTFKSKSVCYTDTAGNIRKQCEFYTCQPYGSSYILYPRYCNQEYVVVNDPVLGMRYFNPYNEATGTCDAKPNPADVMPPMQPPSPHPC